MTENQHKHSIAALLDVMAALRHPETGCPWDLQQTFESIAPYTLEEAYEVADAIGRGDLVDLRDELGDLLLQVVYHARMAEERQAFDFSDVVDAITRKMIRRHPHVFGTPEQRAEGAAPGFWERIKAEERADKQQAHARVARQAPAGEGPSGQSASSKLKGTGLLSDVPAAMPALVRAIKLQAKAARVGFDWPSLAPVLAKMREELDELDEALGAGNQDRVANEFGDLLFVMANVARHLGIDAEDSLRRTNAKFVRRFERIEQLLADEGRRPADATLEEMDAFWEQAKTEERAAPQE